MVLKVWVGGVKCQVYKKVHTYMHNQGERLLNMSVAHLASDLHVDDPVLLTFSLASTPSPYPLSFSLPFFLSATLSISHQKSAYA